MRTSWNYMENVPLSLFYMDVVLSQPQIGSTTDSHDMCIVHKSSLVRNLCKDHKVKGGGERSVIFWRTD
jgi:hypothetical protein